MNLYDKVGRISKITSLASITGMVLAGGGLVPAIAIGLLSFYGSKALMENHASGVGFKGLSSKCDEFLINVKGVALFLTLKGLELVGKDKGNLLQSKITSNIVEEHVNWTEQSQDIFESWQRDFKIGKRKGKETAEYLLLRGDPVYAGLIWRCELFSTDFQVKMKFNGKVWKGSFSDCLNFCLNNFEISAFSKPSGFTAETKEVMRDIVSQMNVWNEHKLLNKEAALESNPMPRRRI